MDDKERLTEVRLKLRDAKRNVDAARRLLDVASNEALVAPVRDALAHVSPWLATARNEAHLASREFDA